MRAGIKFIAACFSGMLTISTSTAQESRIVTAGFWNVENLYDTVPSPFYDDSAYTPTGSLKWDTGRYTNKLDRLATVIDSLSLDVLGLAEVENEAVLRDLIRRLETPYNYIHHTGGDSRGLDLVLLYKGDRFIPDTSRLVRSGTSREFLHVRGELLDMTVDFIVCHLPSRLNKSPYRARAVAALAGLCYRLQERDPAAQIILMGDFNCAPDERPLKKYFARDFPPGNGFAQMYSPFAEKAAKGYGTYAYRGRWSMSDNIYLSPGFYYGTGFTYFSCGIYIRPYLLDNSGNRKGFPLRTFTSGVYRNGYSDHLPVYVVFG